MEQDNLKVLELTLRELRERVLEDEDIKGMFLKHFPDLDYEEVVNETIADLMEYALEKDYDVLNLSLKGAELFFSTMLDNLEDDEDEEEEIQEEEDENYGKA